MNATAEHEARHAAMALRLGLDLGSASAVPVPGESLGHVTCGFDAERAREFAILALAGKIGDEDWPPAWPSKTAPTRDERLIATIVDHLGLDEHGWLALRSEALNLASTGEFGRLEQAIARVLDQGHELDELQLKRIHRICEGTTVEHMTVKAAAAVTTDKGIFEAVISTAAIDRENDVVVPAAMVKALRAWTTTGKLIPLAWDHSLDPADLIGHIDPASVKQVGDEVVASGKVDLNTPRGRDVWRLAKSGTLGFSFGYLIVDSAKRADGTREIRALDVFEVSATAAPMNAATRVLGTKALATRDRARAEMLALLSGSESSPRNPAPATDDLVDRIRAKAHPRPVRLQTFEV